MSGNTFNERTDRTGTNSLKWDYRKEVFGREDILPMWVADADWPTAPSVVDAIVDRAKHGVFGYTKTGDHADRLVINWLENRYGWDVDREWLVYTNGVIPSLSMAIRAFTHSGEGVVLQPPVYYPFYEVVNKSGAKVVKNVLHLDQGRYTMDFEDLVDQCVNSSKALPIKPEPKIMLLCNPHNPVGRVWTKQELTKLSDICVKNDILLISDDIHAEFVYGDNKYTPVPALGEEISDNSITLISPSKAFNTAGLPAAVTVIPNKKIRKTFQDISSKLLGSPSIFGLEALKAAYSEGKEWLDSQLSYLKQNIDYTVQTVNNEIPGVHAIEPEGTMLVWLDFRGLKLNEEELEDLLVGEAKVGLDLGRWFGTGGEGFARINVACSRETLKEGLLRIKRAVRDISCS